MTAYQNGDLDAFAELVARHEKPLWNYLRRFVRDPQTAEDLLQETFMRVIKGAAGWKPTAKFTTWLYTIARNLSLDHARGAVHRRAISLDGTGGSRERESAPDLHERLPARAGSGESGALARELAGALERAIEQLPEPQREVFIMREVLDLPFAEIASAVGVSEATVKSRMRYALERLRAELAELQDDAATEVVR